MPNLVSTISMPLKSGTYTLTGLAGQINSIAYDTKTSTGSLLALYAKYIQNADGTLTLTLFDFTNNVTAYYNLPSLSSNNAITLLDRTNSTTAQFDGQYTFVSGGPAADYSKSTIQYLNIFGLASSSNVITAPISSTSVTTISGGSVNDTITGSAYYSIMDGGG